jgi:hypothetical protein
MGTMHCISHSLMEKSEIAKSLIAPTTDLARRFYAEEKRVAQDLLDEFGNSESPERIAQMVYGHPDLLMYCASLQERIELIHELLGGMPPYLQDILFSVRKRIESRLRRFKTS